MNIEMIYKPKIEHFLEIKNWLEKECNTKSDDVHCNLDYIYNSLNDNSLIVINEDNHSIGFLVYSIRGHVATIHTANIKPNRRRAGTGKIFIKNCCNHFEKMGAYAVELYCSPIESENAWKKFGFLNLPNGMTKETNIFMYKILVQALPFIEDKNSIEKIQLWNNESHNIGNSKATWTWEIERLKSSKKLTKPIVHPANSEWVISWSKGDDIIEKTRIKNFNQKGDDAGKFLIITELF